MKEPNIHKKIILFVKKKLGQEAMKRKDISPNMKNKTTP
jgi:hypothetical protein